MNTRIHAASRNTTLFLKINQPTVLKSIHSNAFYTGYGLIKDFVWKYRFIAFPLIGAAALTTIYFAHKFFFRAKSNKEARPTTAPIASIPSRSLKEYRPTGPSPPAKIYPEGPLFKTIDKQVVLSLQPTMQNTNPRYVQLSLKELDEEGLLPTQTLQIDNIIYYCSAPFLFGATNNTSKDGRIAVLALCVIDGKAYARIFYFSQSQSVWRLLPEVVKVELNNDGIRQLGHFGKGKDEVDTILPIELNVALSLAYLPQESTFPRLEDKAKIPNIVQTAPGGGMWPAYCTPEYREMIQAINPIDKTGEQVIFDEIPMENSPDFSRPLKEFNFWSSLCGDLKGYVYPSRNNVYRYLFCEVTDFTTSSIYKSDANSRYGDFSSVKGKAYLAAMEVVHENPLTIFGNREFYSRLKNIDLPLFEYHKQIPGGFAVVRGSPSLEKYTCAWNVVRQNRLIQEWYQSQKRDLPPAYTYQKQSN